MMHKALSVFFTISLFTISFSLLSENGSDSYVEVLTAQENPYTFKDLAGVDEAVEELSDFVSFLKDPKEFERLGAKVPKGALLIGPPGTGKTSLARALAGEVQCKFISYNGTEFDEKFVGVGASRVRDLFQKARENAPCIIFIDEIDAVGMKRDADWKRGNEQTINQLLAEMDGFNKEEIPIIVIGATNRPDILDPALTRPGRLDRTVEVPNPTIQGRLKILALHAQKKKLSSEIDLSVYAHGTPGFSGAQLENLLNEAAIIATRKKKEIIDAADMEEARDKILLGKMLKDVVLSTHEKKITAYHEAGHTLVRLLGPTAGESSFHKVTIVPRGNTLGVTHFIPTHESHTQSEEDMRQAIMAALGGKAAEEICFKKQFTGASSDLKAATNIARAMVCEYGMSQALGLMAYDRRVHSDKTIERVELEIQTILLDSYQKTKKLLENNRSKLDRLAQELLVKETLSADDVYKLLDMQSSTIQCA